MINTLLLRCHIIIRMVIQVVVYRFPKTWILMLRKVWGRFSQAIQSRKLKMTHHNLGKVF